jgi:hypothetical protein
MAVRKFNEFLELLNFRLRAAGDRDSKSTTVCKVGDLEVSPKSFWIWKHIHVRETHAREMHAYEVHAHEVYLHEMHARKMHAREVHAHETHAHEVHAREMHAREVQINHKRPHMRFVEI